MEISLCKWNSLYIFGTPHRDIGWVNFTQTWHDFKREFLIDFLVDLGYRSLVEFHSVLLCNKKAARIDFSETPTIGYRERSIWSPHPRPWPRAHLILLIAVPPRPYLVPRCQLVTTWWSLVFPRSAVIEANLSVKIGTLCKELGKIHLVENRQKMYSSVRNA
jgi:hypothetical protein